VCLDCARRSALPEAPAFLAQPGPAPPIPAAQLPSHPPATGGGAGAAVLAWTEPVSPAAIRGYQLQAAEAVSRLRPGGAWAEIGDKGRAGPALPEEDAYKDVFSHPRDRRFDAAGLKPGRYYFRVRACSAAGWGQWSAPEPVKVPRPKKPAGGGDKAGSAVRRRA
jgi:hypothetical protein